MKVGQLNRLRVVFQGSDGFLLEDPGTGERVLMPTRSAVGEVSVGQEVNAFVYLGARDAQVATMRRARVSVGQCGYLKVVDVNQVGAFLDWGLSKDLFVPFAEQMERMEVGRSYVVYAYLDNSGRIAASAKLENFLSEDGRDFSAGDPVQILLWERTPLGYKAVVNDTHLGMLFQREVIGDVGVGKRLRGYVAEVRAADHKINLTLQQHTAEARDELQEKILEHLRAHGGQTTLTDKSSPDEIFKVFGVSKKNYKRALGALYRARMVELSEELVRLK